MLARTLLAVTVLLMLAHPARAQEPLATYKSLTPELALDLARASLGDCRSRGYQVAVAVVDRFGGTQVILRDRFAGAHTVSTASATKSRERRISERNQLYSSCLIRRPA
jgi:hypothetical protein